jgi:hypothetical protein
MATGLLGSAASPLAGAARRSEHRPRSGARRAPDRNARSGGRPVRVHRFVVCRRASRRPSGQATRGSTSTRRTRPSAAPSGARASRAPRPPRRRAAPPPRAPARACGPSAPGTGSAPRARPTAGNSTRFANSPRRSTPPLASRASGVCPMSTGTTADGSPRQVSPCPATASRSAPDVAQQRRAPRGALRRAHDAQRLAHRGDLDGRHRVREHERPAVRLDVRAHPRVPRRHEAAVRGERLREGAHHDVDLAEHPLAPDVPRAVRAERAEVVRHVDEQRRLDTRGRPPASRAGPASRSPSRTAPR